MAIQNGDIVGDYQVIDHAGSGGMGAVYKIEHRITKRIEAMKLLTIGISSTPEEVQRFEREIQVQARLSHPNIAALYNAVRDGRSIALIMEYVEGESLQGILERERMPLPTAVDYAGQMLEALSYAHHLGVIHRDVSPANILITREGVAKLTDFGLARAATDLRLTISGVAVGSPWYMSPEQVKAVGEVDARTDIYSMGAVLYEMLTGRKMFEADGSFAVMCGQMETIPEPPSTYNSDVSKALDEVVARALAKDPGGRFQSAGEFRVALANAVLGMGPSASSAHPAERFRTPAAMILVLAASTLVGAVATVRLWPKATHVAAQAPVPKEAVTPLPATTPPAIEAPPIDPAASVPTPDVTADSAKDEARPATIPVRPARRAPKPDPSLAVRVTGGVVDPPAPVPRTNPAKEVETTPAPPVVKPEVAAPTEERPAAVESKANTSEQTATGEPEEVKAPKTGNRFIRALGKINPFGKGAKGAGADPAKTTTKKD